MEKGTTVGSQKIAALFDAGTFVETGAFMKRADGAMTGVVCGYGAIGGKLVYAFSQDSDRKKGAFDALQAEKIAKLYELAIKNGAPVIGMFDSAGAILDDGASVMSAYGKMLKVVSEASGVIPQIAIITGVCAGMAATVAAMFDVVVTVKEVSKLFVNAPFLVGKEVGTSEYTAENGLTSAVAENEAEAFALATRLVAMLPSNNEEGVLCNENADDENRAVAIDGLSALDRVKTVADAYEAVEHISRYGSGHSESIVTENEETARLFLAAVDASCVYHNAPTSFTDGAQFGLGAEIGISTQKLHARGPMALEEITTYKWIIRGNGQTRP